MGKTDGRKINFTKKAIEALLLPIEKRVIYHDSQVPELGLMIQPTGHRSFFWFRKVNGTPTWKTIGPVQELSLEQARDKARQYSVLLREWKLRKYQGDDPFEERGTGETTFSQLVDSYIDRQLKQSAKHPERAEKGVRWAVNFYLSKLKNKRLGEIRRIDILKLFTELGEKRKKITANRTVQLVRTLYNFAVDAELWKGDNPATNIKFYHEVKRTRFLQPDELARLFTALKKEPNPDLRDFVNLSLWTGARKSDVMAMRWQDVSLDDNRWTVPDPKSRTPYVVPLTPEAVEILNSRQRARPENSPWVFPSHGASGHVVDLKRAWKFLLQRAKITALRQHDLRRTQGSWQAAQGASLLVIGKSLGHSSVTATQIYSQLQLDAVRASMTAANQAMVAAMKKKPKVLESPRSETA